MSILNHFYIRFIWQDKVDEDVSIDNQMECVAGKNVLTICGWTRT